MSREYRECKIAVAALPWTAPAAAGGRAHRLEHRGEHLAILTRAMSRGERSHRVLELGEPGLDIVEPAMAMQLAAQRVAHVVDASRRAVLERERARIAAPERAARVSVAAIGRSQIARARTSACERGKLVIVEHVGGRARTARTAGEAAMHIACAARRHPAESIGGRALGDRDLGGERTLVIVDDARPLGAQATPQCHKLDRA